MSTGKKNRRIRVIDVTKEEAELLARALADREVRAFALIVASLQPLSDAGRRRVLTFAVDAAEELARVTVTDEKAAVA